MTIATNNNSTGNLAGLLNQGATTVAPKAAPTTSAGASDSSASGAATIVSLSSEAMAALATRAPGQRTLATVIADARAALDNRYKSAKVTGPLAGGNPTIDLTSLDRRTVFAIASNSGGKFTADEQTLASSELQHRFDAAMAPAATTAHLVGDYGTLYKAALDYLNGMSPDEKATPTWTKQSAALTQGFRATQQRPATLPEGIPNDPIADFTKRTQNTATAPADDFNTVAAKTRLALDQQYGAAKQKGSEIVFNSQRRTGQLINLTGLDNRSLSAMSMNQNKLFSPDETRAASSELQARTRTRYLQAFQQGQSSGDPRAFSLGIIRQYQSMSPEERHATSWSSHVVDLAVKNYKTASSLMSILGS
jgi:hypothetical protein